MVKYTFYKQTKKVTETIKAKYDPLKEWYADPKGYFLIRINPLKKNIEVGFATNDHVIRKIIQGTYASEIYRTILRHKLLTRFEHAAYLGKELYKAELALRYGKRYIQDAPQNFIEMKERVKLKMSS